MIRDIADPMPRRPLAPRLTALAAALALLAGPALAQAPAPVDSAPLSPPASPSPAAPAAPASPAAPAPQSPAPPSDAPATAARPTLVPNPGDPANVDEVVLVGKPVAVLAGTSTWDDGFQNLKNAFRTIEGELKLAGITPTGRPITRFVETDDMGFRYEAMIPIPPQTGERLSAAIRFGRTPDGKAYRFVHKDPYDEIDSTYETITAYLDAKNIVAKDAFLEEYVTDLTEPSDPNLEINIYVEPK